MKSVLNVGNIESQGDVISIRETIAGHEGVIACEINLIKKEISLVYDDKSVSLDNIINSIESLGYNVL